MVIDTLSEASSSRQLGSGFAAGLDWLAMFNPDLADGRYDIRGDEVYALVQSYETVPASEKKYESHRMYADIQYVASGIETIHYAPTTALTGATDYDPVKDFQLYVDPSAATPLHLPPGSFAIFLPHDGHKPGCLSGSSCRVKKVVIKVRV